MKIETFGQYRGKVADQEDWEISQRIPLRDDHVIENAILEMEQAVDGITSENELPPIVDGLRKRLADAKVNGLLVEALIVKIQTATKGFLGEKSLQTF